jgi:hypothetical protein
MFKQVIQSVELHFSTPARALESSKNMGIKDLFNVISAYGTVALVKEVSPES